MLYNKIKIYLSNISINVDDVNQYFELVDNSDGNGSFINLWDSLKIGVDQPTQEQLDSISELDVLKEQIIPQIKIEANKRILTAYPEWQQRNYMAAVVEIHNKEILAMKAVPFIAQYTLTADELQTIRDVETCKAVIAAIRNKSNQLETSLDSMTLDQLKDFDPTDDKNWV